MEVFLNPGKGPQLAVMSKYDVLVNGKSINIDRVQLKTPIQNFR